MTRSQNTINTSAEVAENAVLPKVHEVYTDPDRDCQKTETLPPALRESMVNKSPAQWAYERLILYIQNFEKTLDADQEIAMGLTGSSAGVIRIEGMGYFDPDIVTFYGRDEGGPKTQIIQHVSQLNVMLVAMPKPAAQSEPARIGFRLGRALNRHADVTAKPPVKS
jgi:hypothetical protein